MSAMFMSDGNSACLSCALGAVLILLIAQQIIRKKEGYSQMAYKNAKLGKPYAGEWPTTTLPLSKAHENRISVGGINWPQARLNRLRVPYQSAVPH